MKIHFEIYGLNLRGISEKNLKAKPLSQYISSSVWGYFQIFFLCIKIFHVQEEGEGLNPNEIIKGCSLSETKYILEHFYTKSIETVRTKFH